MKPPKIPCEHCRQPFEKTRPWARFCSSSCRRANFDTRKRLPSDATSEGAARSVESAAARLARLRSYTLPIGRMPTVRKLAERMHGLTEPAEILGALQNFEGEMIELGGRCDPQLEEAVAMVERTFRGARLMKSTY